LKLCIASVADQGLPVEHIVQDAGSDDGTLDWLRTDRRVQVVVERDQGMYDAVNRGLRRAQGEILCYLNCDEQYLPGALAHVRQFFQSHPEVELLFGDFIVTDVEGRYLCHRRVLPPLLNHLWVSHLPTFSCGIFFRRQLLHEHGLWFNPKLRDVGDGDWMLRVLQRGTRMAALRQFTSVFGWDGRNMSAGANASREADILRAGAPAWVRASKPIWIWQHRLRQFLHGAYSTKPFSYELFTRRDSERRVIVQVDRPTGRWLK
jgi:glycosyltransferase involved in cell wall biosynthesis